MRDAAFAVGFFLCGLVTGAAFIGADLARTADRTAYTRGYAAAVDSVRALEPERPFSVLGARVVPGGIMLQLDSTFFNPPRYVSIRVRHDHAGAIR